MIRLPRRFYEDHRARDLPAPPALKETKSHVWIDVAHEAVPELLSDARYHESEALYFDPPMPGLYASARATVKAIEKGVRDREEELRRTYWTRRA